MTSKRVRELLSDLNRAISSFDSNDPLKKERENLIRERDVIVRYHGNVDDMCKDISKRIKRASRPVDSGKKNKKMGSEIQEIFRERDESLVMVQKRQSQVMDLFRAHKTLHGRCPAPPRTSNESYKQRVKDETRRLEESETKSRRLPHSFSGMGMRRGSARGTLTMAMSLARPKASFPPRSRALPPKSKSNKK